MEHHKLGPRTKLAHATGPCFLQLRPKVQKDSRADIGGSFPTAADAGSGAFSALGISVCAILNTPS